VSARAISQKFGVSHDAVGRHWRNHVAEETRSALVAGTLKAGVDLEKLVIEESTGVLEAFQIVRGGLYQLYAAAVEMGDRNGGALLAGRLHENLRDVARLTGQLQQHMAPSVVNNIVIHAVFADVEAGLIRILQPHPDIMRQVIALFRESATKAPLDSLPQPIDRDALDAA